MTVRNTSRMSLTIERTNGSIALASSSVNRLSVFVDSELSFIFADFSVGKCTVVSVKLPPGLPQQFANDHLFAISCLQFRPTQRHPKPKITVSCLKGDINRPNPARSAQNRKLSAFEAIQFYVSPRFGVRYFYRRILTDKVFKASFKQVRRFDAPAACRFPKPTFPQPAK